MISFNLSFMQERTEDGQFVFRLEPYVYIVGKNIMRPDTLRGVDWVTLCQANRKIDAVQCDCVERHSTGTICSEAANRA